jgi:polar amino acid transport system substrate-binding protein
VRRIINPYRRVENVLGLGGFRARLNLKQEKVRRASDSKDGDLWPVQQCTFSPDVDVMKSTPLTAIAIVACCALSACGGSTASPKASRSNVPADLVPAAVRARGVLRVGGDASYPPMESLDNAAPVGFDVDLTREIAKKLDLKSAFSNVSWDNLVPALAKHDLDVVASSMTDTADRQKDRDFIDYLNAGTQPVVRAGNPHHVGDLGALGACGVKLAYQAETTQADQATILANHCEQAGKPAPAFVETSSSENPIDAVTKGSADAAMVDFPVAAGSVAGGGVEMVGHQVEAAPYGYAVAKDAGLMPAIQSALRAVMDDGTYDRLLKKWGITAGSLKTAARNGGA